MRTWIIAGHKVDIPYRWHQTSYNGGEFFEAPKQPKKEENYQEITMFEVVRKCEAYIMNKWSDKHKKGSELARYPKIIADVKRDLVSIEEKITEAKSNVTMTDRRILVLKRNSSKTAKEMDLLDELIELRVMLNKEKNRSINEKKRLVKEEEEAFEEVLCQVVEAEKLHNDKAEDKSTTVHVDSLLDKFRKRKKEANNTTTSSNNKSSSNRSALTDKVILAKNLDNDSVVSAISRNTITETLPCITIPATRVADVDITIRSVGMKRYESIVGKPINNTIGQSNCNMDVLVEVEPEILTCLLDPGTKRLLKIASNEIQENEVKIWNMATNSAIYKPDGANSLNWSPLRYRPNISSSPAFKDSVKMTDQQTQLNQIYDTAMKKAQLVVNKGMEAERELQEKEKRTIIQKTGKEYSDRIRSW